MTETPTAVDALESALGGKLTVALLSVPNRLDLAVRQRLARAHRGYEERRPFPIPAATNSEVFPYVHPRWTIGGVLGGYQADLSNPEAIERIERNIKKILLYYHRVALPCGFS